MFEKCNKYNCCFVQYHNSLFPTVYHIICCPLMILQPVYHSQLSGPRTHIRKNLSHFHTPCWCAPQQRFWGRAFLSLSTFYIQPTDWNCCRHGHQPAPLQKSRLSLEVISWGLRSSIKVTAELSFHLSFLQFLQFDHVKRISHHRRTFSSSEALIRRNLLTGQKPWG